MHLFIKLFIHTQLKYVTLRVLHTNKLATLLLNVKLDGAKEKNVQMTLNMKRKKSKIIIRKKNKKKLKQ